MAENEHFVCSYVSQAFYVAMYIYDKFCIKIHTVSG